MKQMLAWGVMLFSLHSCSLQKQTTNTSKTLDIYGAGVIQKPVLTNLKVNPTKITSNYSASGTQGVAYHKTQAIAKAMLENKADVIIEPAYEITSTASSVSIVLTGYAANYENFRQITAADTALMNAGIINYNDEPGETIAPEAKKKKGKGALALLTLVLAGAAVAGSVL